MSPSITPSGGGGGGSLPALVSRSFTAEEIEASTNATTPLEIVAAPGAGTTLMPLSCAAVYEAGAVPFSADISAGIDWTNLGSLLALSALPASGVVSALTCSVLSTATALLSDCDGLALVLAPTGATRVGPLLAATVNAGGSGYAPGDTGIIFNTSGLTGAANATYEVTTVDGGGGVTGFIITDGGANYVAPFGGATTGVTTGGGDGSFTVDIATITPLTDGVLRLTLAYVAVPTA